jgi:hypothetical protein
VQHGEPQFSNVRDQCLILRRAACRGLGGELFDLPEKRWYRAERQPDHGTIGCLIRTRHHAEQFRAGRVEALYCQLVAEVVWPGFDGERETVGRDLGVNLGQFLLRCVPCGFKLARQLPRMPRPVADLPDRFGRAAAPSPVGLFCGLPWDENVRKWRAAGTLGRTLSHGAPSGARLVT